ncbi:MAG: class I SAM-dependent methyltransferase [Ruminococcus sp.]|nr:class I SAM-dependent methyltransferase [Ruminococcus sp.]
MEYNKKFNKSKFGKFFIKNTNRIIKIGDYFYDKKICGCSLIRYVPSLYRESKGATGSQSTHYVILDEIFQNAVFSENDCFIDVGCGKGRILAYMLREKFPGEIHGIELNQEVGDYCKAWAEKYPQVHVNVGDAFALNYDKYTVMFMGRPFLPDMFHQFIEKLEQDMTHPLKLYYWVDQQSGDFLNDRPGWNMHRREWIYKKNGFYLASSPQRYSVWTYTPAKNL